MRFVEVSGGVNNSRLTGIRHRFFSIYARRRRILTVDHVSGYCHVFLILNQQAK
jgi:hypothetical protein